MSWTPIVLGTLLLALIAARLCHAGILWSDGDYHLAAAMQVHGGKTLYRDLWYDKPPVTALLLDAAGRPMGWPLSLAEAVVAWLACCGAFLTGNALGGRRAGWLAAALLAFFLTFYIPTAVIPIAPDLLMIAPHLAAVYCSLTRRPRLAGFCAAVAFWINTKGAFVLAACLAIAPAEALSMLIGFAAPCCAALLALALTGSWSGYVDQVWRWGLLYASHSPNAHPWANAFTRSLNWMGFHAALVLGAIFYFRKEPRARWMSAVAWMAISYLAVAQGMRFLPRYWFQLLAPLCVIAAVGFAAAPRRWWILALALVALAVPLARFGPAYGKLAADDFAGRAHHWADLALDQDDRAVAALIAKSGSEPAKTLFVWGYRPGIYCYTGFPAPTQFWDSQPLTGVPADRHLIKAEGIDDAWAERNRRAFAVARPDFLVDALSTFNPRLSMDRYPELRPLLTHYRKCGATALSSVYCFQ